MSTLAINLGYAAFIRNAFLGMLSYRLRYFTGIITYILFVSVQYFIWKAVYYDRAPGETINGFTLAEMVTYVSVAWVSRSFYFSNVDEEMDELVKTGAISTFLLRPINLHLAMLARAAGESLFRILFFSAPICIAIYLLFPIAPAADPYSWVLFSFSCLVAFFVMAEINFLVGLLSLWVYSVQGISRAKYMLTQLMSGLWMPVAFFPEWFRWVIEVLPLKYLSYIPMQFYLGRLNGAAAVQTIIGQIVWCVGLFILCEWAQSRALRKLTIQGG
jgi:ABC-2 type transport system permease protein